MTKSTAVTARQIMFSDITNLTRLLNRAEYNCKAVLKHKDKPFDNHKKFALPNTTYEESRRYTLNNLIDLKELLNSLDLGIKEEAPKVADEPI